MDRAKMPLRGTVVVVARVSDGREFPAEAVGTDGHEILLAVPGGGTAGDAGPAEQGAAPPSPGSAVVLRWDNACEAFAARGVVVKGHHVGAERWRVALTSEPERARSRRYARVRLAMPVRLTRGEAAPVAALAVDLSEGGMRLRLPRGEPPLRRADTVQLAFTLGATRVRCAGVVVHTASERDDEHEADYGIAFAGLPARALELLAGVVHRYGPAPVGA